MRTLPTESNSQSKRHTEMALKNRSKILLAMEFSNQVHLGTTVHYSWSLKKAGSLRVVQDFKVDNPNSLDDKYFMKDINKCFEDIGRSGFTIFTTLDLTSGF
jgi:hypothetical protein